MTTSNQFEERYIGRGAMGNVYELKGHEPPAVIKYMFCENDEQLKIFKNECDALKKIYHVNVVRLYRYIQVGTRVGIVMEYCQRGPLREVILDPIITYTMNTALTWAIQLFDAIRYMYQKHKLVHRDIKPDNIFVTNEYQLKIGDFGLVKEVENVTVTGTLCGTPRYRSPPDMKEDGVQRDVYEQISTSNSNSHRNDVYSLGLVMWEIIERRTIFTNYEFSGVFDRDRLLFDIALRRVTEIEPPECQSKIRKIISRCTNFQRIHRPTASEVMDLLDQIQETNEFISSLPFMPTEDQKQKELMKPIGFDDETEWVMVESEERKYTKRFEEDKGYNREITTIMRDKLGRLNSADKEEFYKEAPNIVSRLKEETQTFKETRYVMNGIMKVEEKKKNLHEKNIFELFELFVFEDFIWQLVMENMVFTCFICHTELWNYESWRVCASFLNGLEKDKREKYTTHFYFRCFLSQLTGEEWIQIDSFELSGKGYNEFVSEDLNLWKRTEGKWLDNPRAEIWSYEFENEDKKRELFNFSHYKQIPFERIIDAKKKELKTMENIIKSHLKYLVPIEDSERNNVPFDIPSIGAYEQLDETSWNNSNNPFPHYIFQLRNPPRPTCQKKHLGKCQMKGFRKMGRWLSDLPKELHIPVCNEIKKNEISFLECYLDWIRPDRDLRFRDMKNPFLFLCCQNLLGFSFLILLDHPNNYEDEESIPGLEVKTWIFSVALKLHNVNVGVLRKHFQESKFNETVYAMIKSDKYDDPDIRLIDYQGNPKTEWLDLKEVAESGFLFTGQ